MNNTETRRGPLFWYPLCYCSLLYRLVFELYKNYVLHVGSVAFSKHVTRDGPRSYFRIPIKRAPLSATWRLVR